jgi:hypothetical protein
MPLKISKLVSKMTPAELTEYLVQHAAKGPYTRTTIMKAPLTRGLKRLLEGYDNNRYTVALIIDRLLEVGWPGSERGISESMVTIGVFDYALRDMGGSQQPWKYLYFRRFRETLEEREYFTHYLGVLEDCQVRLLGSQPASYPEVTWQSKEREALKCLENAATVIEERLDAQGTLTEWPVLPARHIDESLHSFIHDPKRSSLLPSRRDDVSTR